MATPQTAAAALVHGMAPLSSSFPNKRPHGTAVPPSTLAPWAVTRSSLVQGTSKRRVDFGGDAIDVSAHDQLANDQPTHEPTSPRTGRSMRSKTSRFDFATFSRTGLRRPPRGAPSAHAISSSNEPLDALQYADELELDGILSAADALEVHSMLAMDCVGAMAEVPRCAAPPVMCKSPSFVELNLADACDMTDIFATLCAEDEANADATQRACPLDDVVINLPTPELDVVCCQSACPFGVPSPSPPLQAERGPTVQLPSSASSSHTPPIQKRKRVYVPTGRPRGRPRLDGTPPCHALARTALMLDYNRRRRERNALRRNDPGYSQLFCAEQLPAGPPYTWLPPPTKRRAAARNAPRRAVLLDYGDWKYMLPSQIMSNASNMKTIRTLCSYRVLANHCA